jgi:hypothetical protein
VADSWWEIGAVDPTEAINIVETVLRRAVRQVLGDSWHEGTGVDRGLWELARIPVDRRLRASATAPTPEAPRLGVSRRSSRSLRSEI